MEKDENDIKKNEQENVNSQVQENTTANKRMAQTSLKGAAAVAGAYVGGSTGAVIGSKAADVINNSKVGDAITDAAAQVGNVANKMSPTGKTNQKLTNAVANSGVLDLVDKGIDASAANYSPSPKSKIPDKTAKKTSLNESNNPAKKKENTPTIGGKNPSRNKYNDTIKKHSNHADGSNDYSPSKESRDSKKSNSPLKKNGLFPKKKLNNSESESEEESIQKDLKNLGNMLKLTAGLISGFFGVLGAIVTFIITHIVLISIVLIIAAIVILISIIVTLIVSSFQYGKEDDGTVCYVTPSCNKVVIKSENGDKTYSMDEYIAGAIVNYYEHDDYAVMDTDVDQNLLKAFSVVIHSDIAAYSDYDYTNETCTVNEESRFNDIYIPTIQKDTTNNDDTSSDNEDDSSSGKLDGVSGDDAGQNTQVSEEQPEEDEETKRKNDYYNKAKTAADSVITEVVDIYTQRLDIFYDGYKSILGTSSATGSDYKKIIRDYIEGSPDYEEVTFNNDSDITEDGSTSEDDNTKDDNDGEAIGIYPVCDYQKDSSNNNNGSIGTVVVNDLCSQVKVVDNMIGTGNGHDKDFSGVYSFDEFIAGVVANEIDSRWKQYPDILKAHAVAARTYLYNTIKYNKKAGSLDGDTCTITTSLSTMGFKPNTSAEITQAVQETSGEYIMVNGQISRQAQWDAFTYASKDSEYYYLKQKNLKVPIKWIESRISQGTISYNHQHSHGNGMSQWGAAYLVIEQGKNYKEVIQFFYDADIAKTTNGYVMPINTFTMITGEKSIGYCKNRDAHTGTDFAAPIGTPVYAATSGVIEKEYSFAYQCYYKEDAHYSDCLKSNPNAGDNRAGQGFKIKNDDGTYSVYFHFSKKENLHKGDRVTAGQKIGEVGTTGLSSGPHLHYEMRLTSVGNSVDPRNYLPMEGYSICYNNPYYKP